MLVWRIPHFGFSVFRRFLNLKIIAVVCGLLLAIVSQKPVRTDVPRNITSVAAAFLSGLDSRGFRLSVLGQEGLLSSIVWVAAIMEIADRLFQGGDLGVLSAQIRMTVALDSAWEYPYEFGGIVLEKADGTPMPEALELLAAGVMRFPHDARKRLILSQKILQAGWLDSLVRTDSAARILVPLANDINAPAYSRTLAFTLLNEASGLHTSLLALCNVWRGARDPFSRLMFQDKTRDLLERSAGLDPSLSSKVAAGLAVVIEANENVDHTIQELVDGLASTDSRDHTIMILTKLADSTR